MSPSCQEARGRFAAYAEEALSAEERCSVREHLAGCGACRSEAAAADPTLLFAGSALRDEVPAEDVARVLEGVRAAVAWKQAERRLSAGRAERQGGRRRAAAVVAAAAVAFFTLSLPGGLAPRRQAPAGAAALRQPTPGLVRASGPAPVEAAGATVYEIAPGSGSDEPRVVWIVDQSLDI